MILKCDNLPSTNDFEISTMYVQAVCFNTRTLLPLKIAPNSSYLYFFDSLKSELIETKKTLQLKLVFTIKLTNDHLF